MEFKDNIPIYLQIEQYLFRQIAIGKLPAGQKVPSVRKLALELTVNVNTVQRALQQMNDQGILYTKRGEGNFVTEDKELLAQTKRDLVNDELSKFVQNIRELGIGKEEILPLLEQYLQQEDNNE
ncbi:GntR family transcriptional regulator [Lactobacillus sp. ESL0791]|uniref:GntR family transcriptional regulator n=1 Tax=Lactobacillus sp. ESL0791 TaxID=2983234 RepID=UPI0023F83AD7|nr:GntR family transcriptional regulator [Lactobacillus sp. ESL0791]MDF7638953.1 GntR family transcriptional regulator [Lactobacillus sp. ESL0791]